MNFLKNLLNRKSDASKAIKSFVTTDVHSHLIPNIDDGSQSMDETIGLIIGYKELGFTKLITTPHIITDHFPNTPSSILSGLEEVKKELVKNELSKRYYNHYLSISNNPEEQPQSSAPSTPEASSPVTDGSGKDEPARDQAPFAEGQNGQAEGYLAAEEDLASIAEVALIKLTTPASQGTAADLAEKSPSDKPAKKKYCFIATAAYGSPLAQEVVLLQNYRDTYLAPNVLGEKFIQTYYRYSPYLARQVNRNKLLKLLARCLLSPLICLIKKTSGDPGSS